MLVDWYDDVILTQKINLGGPFLDSIVIYSFEPLFGFGKLLIEEGILEVDALGHFRMLPLKLILQPSEIEGDQVVIQKLAVVEFLNVSHIYPCPIFSNGRVDDRVVPIFGPVRVLSRPQS
jgi:hypothetical protein